MNLFALPRWNNQFRRTPAGWYAHDAPDLAKENRVVGLPAHPEWILRRRADQRRRTAAHGDALQLTILPIADRLPIRRKERVAQVGFGPRNDVCLEFVQHTQVKPSPGAVDKATTVARERDDRPPCISELLAGGEGVLEPTHRRFGSGPQTPGRQTAEQN